ncbi:protein translocase subunit SecF [Maricaulis sp.]|uniref:protein translocase subunit SecF n=1 Tax=Maricaulis sp. TaxID=1486257 RepID=UPI003A8EFCB8
MSLALIRFLPTTANLPFIKIRMWAIAFSLLLVLGSLFEFANVGINFGIDFRGGIQTEVRTEEPADVEAMRTVVGDLNLGEPRIQQTGDPHEVLISLPLQPGEGLEGEEAQQDARRALEAALESSFPDIELRGTDVIGGSVSGELVVKGFMAVSLALFLMLIYIWFQFEWQFSVGAILALTHDVIATVGMFSVTQMTFDLATVAAILTIVGYSMNDTVIVYDRIRENLRKYKKMPLGELLNMSINDTLSRTILTSSTTLVALVSLYLIGGEALKSFSFAMIWGVVIGTYSSIFVAAPLLLLIGVKRDANEND